MKGGAENLLGPLQPLCVAPDPCPIDVFISTWPPGYWRGSQGLSPSVQDALFYGTRLGCHCEGMGWPNHAMLCGDPPADPRARLGQSVGDTGSTNNPMGGHVAPIRPSCWCPLTLKRGYFRMGGGGGGVPLGTGTQPACRPQQHNNTKLPKPFFFLML